MGMTKEESELVRELAYYHLKGALNGMHRGIDEGGDKGNLQACAYANMFIQYLWCVNPNKGGFRVKLYNGTTVTLGREEERAFNIMNESTKLGKFDFKDNGKRWFLENRGKHPIINTDEPVHTRESEQDDDPDTEANEGNDMKKAQYVLQDLGLL